MTKGNESKDQGATEPAVEKKGINTTRVEAKPAQNVRKVKDPTGIRYPVLTVAT